MGLLDFFSRLTGQRESGALPDDGPRCDHYTFTHVALRRAVFQDPAGCVAALGSSEVDSLIDRLWEEVLETCRAFEVEAVINPRDIMVHQVKAGSFPCTLIEMPAPERPTEAFFVAMLLMIDFANPDQGFQVSPVRYFTLENGEPDDDEITTVVGEWMADETHATHGPGPWPTADEFVECITGIVGRRRLA